MKMGPCYRLLPKCPNDQKPAGKLSKTRERLNSESEVDTEPEAESEVEIDGDGDWI
jgi:hypothetical protein